MYTVHLCLSTELVCDALWKKIKRGKAPIIGLSCCFLDRTVSLKGARLRVKHTYGWSNTRCTFWKVQVYFFFLFKHRIPCLAVQLHVGRKLKAHEGSTPCLWAIKRELGRVKGLELWEGRKQRKVGVGWDIKKIVSVWLMVLYGSLMSSDGQDDWHTVWPLVTAHHLHCPPPPSFLQLTSHSGRLPATVKWTTKNTIKPTD